MVSDVDFAGSGGDVVVSDGVVNGSGCEVVNAVVTGSDIVVRDVVVSGSANDVVVTDVVVSGSDRTGFTVILPERQTRKSVGLSDFSFDIQ